MEQAKGTGAACAKSGSLAAGAAAGATGAVEADTAFNAPVLMVDFSVVVAASARR